MKNERSYPWGQNQSAENIDFSKMPDILSQNNYQVILITGPNGVGKGTIIKGLLDCDEGITQVLRTSTKTIGVTDNQYHQVTDESFFVAVDAGEFIEWSKYGQGYYGTSIRDITQSLEKGKKLVVDIDLDGGIVLREFFKKMGVRVHDCFVSPITQKELEGEDGIEKAVAELQARLLDRNRGEWAEELEGRLRNARQTLLRAREFSYYVANVRDGRTRALMAIQNLIE